jgi:epoxide hydrolase-like predicted phosphatase
MPVTPLVKAVIFDFGGVLVRTRSQHLREAWEKRLNLERGGAEALIFGGERGTAVQCGRVTDEAHWQWLGEHLGLSAGDLAALRLDFFAEDLLDADLLAYVDQLREAGLHAGLLSNAGDNARQIFGERYNVLPHFDSVTVSAEEGVMKPDPRIFRTALARAGAQPNEAVFLDDFVKNVEGARQVGMHAILFRTTRQAVEELAALTGVAPAPSEPK